MTDTAAYIRVSTQEQALTGVSVADQTARLQAAYPDSWLFPDEGVSAGKPMSSRPQGALLLEEVESGRIKRVVVTKLDRLFRSASEALVTIERWEKIGCSLLILDHAGMQLDTSTAVGKMMLTMLASMGEFERNIARERTRAAMAHIKSTGRTLGNVNTYERLCPDVPRIIEEMKSCGRPDRHVAEHLNRLGYTTLKGLPWNSDRVRRIFEHRRKARREGRL